MRRDCEKDAQRQMLCTSSLSSFSQTTFRLVCADEEESQQFALRSDAHNAQMIRFMEDELGHYVAEIPNGSYHEAHLMVRRSKEERVTFSLLFLFRFS